MQHGIDVVLDKWELKEGDDKYVFMERSVTDKSITNVLIICDKAYKERADNREGGVGDETTVITPDVYDKSTQSKFIPVVFEKDEFDKLYLPAYIKSRIYIDLSDENEYEKSYEQLLRRIWKKPEEQKPALGKMPSWLENEDVNYNELNLLIKQLKGINDTQEKKYHSTNTDFTDTLISILNELGIHNAESDGEALIKKIENLKPIRDICFDFVQVNLDNTLFSSDLITNFFEKVYNEVGVIEEGKHNKTTLECYNFFKWELFIGVVTLLRHYERYAEIYDMLSHTYFLRDSYFKGASMIPRWFPEFRKYFETLDRYYTYELKRQYYSFEAEMLCTREKLPIFNKQNLTETDLLLYQMSTVILNLGNEIAPLHKIWFPTTYICVTRDDLWVKLKSRKYCKKIFPLFGVNSIEELKNKISRAQYNARICCRGAYHGAPNILSFISLNEIASLE